MYASCKKLPYVKRGKRIFFERETLEHYKSNRQRKCRNGVLDASLSDRERESIFDDCYGRGGYERLIRLLNGNVSFKEIADEFGVSRQTVWAWHKAIYPSDARRKREPHEPSAEDLFGNELFDIFYSFATQHFPTKDIKPIPSGRGARKTAVMLAGRKVLLRKSQMVGRFYQIRNPTAEKAGYIFYPLDEGFLFVPQSIVPSITRFSTSEGSKYYEFMNNFDALG
jgi:hypothetical protein